MEEDSACSVIVLKIFSVQRAESVYLLLGFLCSASASPKPTILPAMQNDTFTLRPTDEFIELTQLLKVKQLAQSGGHAKLLVEEGLVHVNGEQEFRKFHATNLM